MNMKMREENTWRRGETPDLPLLNRLSEIGCQWWVLELNTYKETEETRILVKNYLDG